MLSEFFYFTLYLSYFIIFFLCKIPFSENSFTVYSNGEQPIKNLLDIKSSLQIQIPEKSTEIFSVVPDNVQKEVNIDHNFTIRYCVISVKYIFFLQTIYQDLI